MTRAELEASLERLIKRVGQYHAPFREELLRGAFQYADGIHQDQVRASGDPYISHPLAVAHILADLETDEETIAAGLLHDVIEDCAKEEQERLEELQQALEQARQERRRKDAALLREKIKEAEQRIEQRKAEVVAELTARFSSEVTHLVEGVTRLSGLRFRRQEDEEEGEESEGMRQARSEEVQRALQAENLRRMFMATARDLRVLVIKLSDRLHNLQTLSFLPPAKRERIARESELIYARLAHRLGIWRLKWEMEDLAFKYLHPREYEEVAQRVARTREQRLAQLNEAVAQVKEALAKAGIVCDVQGRPKHLYSIYQKMMRQEIDFEDIYDLSAIRVIVHTEHECYEALWVVHSLWPHLPEHFADYISRPKPNGYQSLHTKVMVPHQGPMEVQIRTWKMHRVAEHGVAAHWRYKAEEPLATGLNRLSSFRQLLDSASEETSLDEDFLSTVLRDLWEQEVFVLTPKGEVIDLPMGATPVDFAYRIHTEVGHTCKGAKVNKRLVPLDYQLQNGDIVEILCHPHTGPSRDWLRFVKTGQARSRIKAYLRRQHREERLQSGRRALEREALRLQVDLSELFREDRTLYQNHSKSDPSFTYETVLERVAKRLGFPSEEDLLVAIGNRTVSAEHVVHRLRQEVQETRQRYGKVEEEIEVPEAAPIAPRRMKVAVSAGGVDHVYFRRSKCCLPIPGDHITGYITRGQGVTIHRNDCPNLKYLREHDLERIVELEWTDAEELLYDVPLNLRGNDRIGLLNDITTVISNNGLNIVSLNQPRVPHSHIATIRIVLEVLDRAEMETLVGELSRIRGIVAIDVRGQRLYEAKVKDEPKKATWH